MKKNGRVRQSGWLASEVGHHPYVLGGPWSQRNPDAVLPTIHGRTRDRVWLRLMQATSPHFLLYSEVKLAPAMGPQWRFVLQSVVGDSQLVAADFEANMCGSRLELLAVVRGLEALAQPSRVTLLTGSRYVSRGIRRGLSQWREREWRWERCGELVPIRDHDLWRRIDRALEFHQVECCAVACSEATANDHGGSGIDGVSVASQVTHFPTAEAASPRPFPMDEALAPERAFGRRTPGVGNDSRISRTFNKLRQSVLAPLAAIWRPAFTWAA